MSRRECGTTNAMSDDPGKSAMRETSKPSDAVDGVIPFPTLRARAALLGGSPYMDCLTPWLDEVATSPSPVGSGISLVSK